MISVGITGGIGSGKTTVCKIFNYNWNIPIYYADDRAKWFMFNDLETQSFIRKTFGNKAYINNELQKNYISEIIFNNEEIKKKWESYIHKKVMNNYFEWREKQKSKYHLHEAALIFEANTTINFNKIILVTSPLELRLNRLQKKGLTKQEAIKRMQHQWNDEEKINKAHFIIHNDEKQSLIEQVVQIHNFIMNL